MSKTNLYKKLLDVKKEVPRIGKDETGYGFKYASPSAVLGKLNPLLNAAGVFLKSEIINIEHERVTVKTTKGEKAETLYHLEIEFTWIDVEHGETDVCKWRSSGMNGDEQGLGSALTYAERYFMLKFFNIPTDEDDPDKLSVKKGAAQTSPPQKKEEPTITWLTKENFEEAMAWTDPLKIKRLIAKYGSATHKMKKEYKDQLTEREKGLRDGSIKVEEVPAEVEENDKK